MQIKTVVTTAAEQQIKFNRRYQYISTMGTNAFRSLPTNWICYVPVGTGDTYKAASGWSTYADHILEEGQTPNRAMLSRLAKAAEKTDESEGDDVR